MEITMRNDKNIKWNDSLIVGIMPGSKRQQKRIDGTCGLYLFTEPSGRKSWYCRYSDSYGNTGSARLGVFAPGPREHLTLIEAKAKAINVMSAIKAGQSAAQAKVTFEEVAEKWLAQYEQESRPATVKSVYNRFSLYVEPAAFYRKNIEDVTRADVREVFGKLKKKPQTAKRVFSIYNMIFKYAIGLGYMNGQKPMPESKYLLPTIHEQSRPAIVDDADRFGDILLKIRAQYESGDNCAGMLLFLAYCFTRPGETRRLQWHNVCYKDNLIKLSKEETKSDAPLLIPITRQVHGLLERQKKRRISPIMPNDYIFFAPQKGPKYTMSDALPGNKLRQLGIAQEEQSAHGFRSCALTFLREYLGAPDDLVEIQLNHKLGTEVSRVYNKSTKIQQRREMMRQWCDWMDAQIDNARDRL